MKTAACALFAALALAACNQDAGTPATPEAPIVSEPAVEPAPPGANDAAQMPAEDACNAAQYANLVGRPADMPGVPAASPDVRHIRPDTQVTMDYRAERLNIDISADGVITGFRCG
jgi:hypothetical protein